MDICDFILTILNTDHIDMIEYLLRLFPTKESRTNDEMEILIDRPLNCIIYRWFALIYHVVEIKIDDMISFKIYDNNKQKSYKSSHLSCTNNDIIYFLNGCLDVVTKEEKKIIDELLDKFVILSQSRKIKSARF